jgi:hypothetical protein
MMMLWPVQRAAASSGCSRLPRGRIAKHATAKQRMARKLATKQGRATYARRKAIVEPVFGQMQTVQDARQLLLRGKPAARAQWRFHCAIHNLLKLHRNRGDRGRIAPRAALPTAPPRAPRHDNSIGHPPPPPP